VGEGEIKRTERGGGNCPGQEKGGIKEGRILLGPGREAKPIYNNGEGRRKGNKKGNHNSSRDWIPLTAP